MTPRAFTRALATIDLPSVFNPYSDRCPTIDQIDAARIRRRNLTRYLGAARDVRVKTVWIARDLGHRGGRRTGVPMTDEVHLAEAGRHMGDVSLQRATRGSVVAERTAAIVWQVLERVAEPVLLWNVFPLHPHEPDQPVSNRCHTARERKATWPFMLALIDMVQPTRLVAIGRDAGSALSGLDLPVDTVRHPSHGGQAEFIAGMKRLQGRSPV